jgi:predicted DNA-binding transcriptional regulator YafY
LGGRLGHRVRPRTLKRLTFHRYSGCCPGSILSRSEDAAATRPRKVIMASIDRIHRLLKLIELLQSGRWYNSWQLAELAGVSRQTVFRDLATLQETGIHVLYDERRQGYSLPGRRFLPSTEFTIDEALALVVLCHELGDPNSGVPFQQSAANAAMKIMSNLPGRLREDAGELITAISLRLDPNNPLDESQPIYLTVVRAMGEGRKVRLHYRSLFEQDNICTLVSPYRLHFHRRSWYLIGRSSLHREVRTFNIGRILDAEIVDSTYQVPKRFSLDRHFGDAWNMIREPDQRDEVIIRFQPQVATNVAEVRWHKTQRTVWNDDGTLDFHVSVEGLREIVWWVLGYGEQAEVLEPPELRAEMKRRITSMQQTYATKSAATKPAKSKRKTKRKTKH